MKHESINNMKKKLIISLKASLTVMFSLMFVFSSLMTNIRVYAAYSIPDKGDFKGYVTDMYGLDKEAANYDEKVQNAIADYKNRYILYVEPKYAYGEINESSNEDIYYLNNNGSFYRPPTFNPGKKFMISTPALATTEDITAIWNFLGSKGFTEIAVAGIMGNMQAESGFISNNVENRYTNETGIGDEEYTQMVDDGTFTREEFAKDGAGYGLVQFTYYTYKEDLWDLSKSLGVSISDRDLQLDYLWTQIQKYQAEMNQITDIYEAAVYFQTEFERPEVIDDTTKATRAGYAQSVYDAYMGTGNGDGDKVSASDVMYFQGTIPEGFDKTLYCGDAKYGKSTLKVSGGAPTAIAMVASSLGYKISPMDVAERSSKYYEKDVGSKVEILEDVSQYNLVVTKVGKDIDKVDKALKEGKKVIALTGTKDEGAVEGIFNRSAKQNFVVVFGYDNNGYLKVADPDGANYDNISKRNITLKILKGETTGGFYIYESTVK